MPGWIIPSGQFCCGREGEELERKAKYEEIIEWIRRQIQDGKLVPGDKIPSENELAEEFKVSRQTARHALNVMEMDLMVERRRGSGTYVKEKSLYGKERPQTKRIALVITYVDEYIFPRLVKSIERTLSRAGYTLQIAFTNNAVEKERMILQSLLNDGMIDGVIAEATKSGLPSPNLVYYKRMQNTGLPIVFLNSGYPEIDAPCVSLDDRQAGRLVTEHLIQCGHERIGAIFKSDDGQGHRRYSGYVEALMKAEIKVKGERIVWIDTEDLRHLKEEGERILKRLSDCTACVCYNDEVSNKLVKICMENQIRIPEDLSIIGIDNSDLSKYCEVPLTSATNPLNDLGSTAAEMVVRMIKSKSEERDIRLEAELEIRNSVRIVNERII